MVLDDPIMKTNPSTAAVELVAEKQQPREQIEWLMSVVRTFYLIRGHRDRGTLAERSK